MLEFYVKCVIKEPITSRYVLVLESKEGNHIVPINIGPFEAEAIYTFLKGVKPPKDMTYDFFANMLSHIDNFDIERVVIDDMDGKVYSALVEIKTGDKKIKVKCRPSDAIALGLRKQVPVYVDTRVVETSNCVSKECLNESEKEFLEAIITDQGTTYWNV